jgi:hypothetical protein
MRRFIFAALLALGVPPALVQAQQPAPEAVLFVTDFSNSMNFPAASPPVNLVPVLLERYFDRVAATRQGVTVGLITFGDEGVHPGTMSTCAQDVHLRVTGDTALPAARGSVMARVNSIVNRRATRGYTPIYVAMDKAGEEAARLIADGKARRVRIVLITDLADTCAAGTGFRQLRSDEYCALGKGLVSKVYEGREDYRGLFRLEYVVAMGSNSRNIGKLAECADANPLDVNNMRQAEEAAEQIAEPLVPDTFDLRVDTALVEGADSLGRALPARIGKVTLAGLDGTVTLDPGQSVQAEAGTIFRAALIPEFGIASATQDVTLDQSRTVTLQWQLPWASITFVEPDGRTPVQGSRLLLRTEDRAAQRLFLAAPDLKLPLLPGRYQVVAGFPDGGIVAQTVVLDRTSAPLAVVIRRPGAEVTARWHNDPEMIPAPETGLTAAVVAAGGSPLELRPDGMAAGPFGADSALKIQINRGSRTEWSADLTERVRAARSITLVGGLIWVTASGPEDAEWKLVDRTGTSPLSSEFRGRDFFRALPPGQYQLFRDGIPLCPEGESFQLRIGNPVDFGSAPDWNRKACQ